MYFTDEVFELLMVEQTNLYTEQVRTADHICLLLDVYYI